MSAINFALNEVRHRIPKEILNLLFKQNQGVFSNDLWNSVANAQTQSMDALIKSKVIYDRVNPMCQLVGAEEVFIPLDGVPRKVLKNRERIYTIPPELLAGKEIISALAAYYYDIDNGTFQSMGPGFLDGNGLSLADRMTRLNKNQGRTTLIDNVDLKVVGKTSIAVRSGTFTALPMCVRVLLSSDKEMSHIKGKAKLDYAELVVLATMAYIYNNLNIPMDRGTVISGVSNNRIREVVDNYSDADERLREYYNEYWGKVSFMNDRNRMNNFVNDLFGKK